MTREQFIKILKDKGYEYELDGNKIIVVSYNSLVNLKSLTEIPPGVVFNNDGVVDLGSLIEIPSGVVFNNRTHVMLNSIESLPSDVVFKNGGSVWLNSLRNISPGVNLEGIKDGVYLESLIGGWLHEWEGNLDELRSSSLLNVMISKGMFI